MIKHVAYRVVINDSMPGDLLGTMIERWHVMISGCHVVEQCIPTW